jgi:gas vesicle protein
MIKKLLLVVAAVGLGILLAPKEGRETRRSIADKVSKVMKKAK